MQKDIEMKERDFFKDPFTEEELRALLGDTNPSEVFSWRSPSFRKLNLLKEDLSDDDLVRLMLEEPRLIRRPIVQVGGALIVGFDKAALNRAFAQEL